MGPGLLVAASFGFGVRRAAAKRRMAEEEAQVRASLKAQRKAARRGGGLFS